MRGEEARSLGRELAGTVEGERGIDLAGATADLAERDGLSDRTKPAGERPKPLFTDRGCAGLDDFTSSKSRVHHTEY